MGTVVNFTKYKIVAGSCLDPMGMWEQNCLLTTFAATAIILKLVDRFHSST